MASGQFEYSLQDKGPYLPSIETISTHIAETHDIYLFLLLGLVSKTCDEKIGNI